jgi:PhnB protein
VSKPSARFAPRSGSGGVHGIPLREDRFARLLWSLGSVAGLEFDGAPFFLHQPAKGGFDSPKEVGASTVRVELFVDEPDGVIARAVAAGATGGEIRDHIVPWGTHRQGGLTDPFGHIWLVGDKSPLQGSG